MNIIGYRIGHTKFNGFLRYIQVLGRRGGLRWHEVLRGNGLVLVSVTDMNSADVERTKLAATAEDDGNLDVEANTEEDYSRVSVVTGTPRRWFLCP